jgi:tRNA pseudouridine32 synthase/23S rRNA pseudouridine746 synthase
MHQSPDPQVLPVRNGVSPSCVALPPCGTRNMLEFLAERLPNVARDVWLQRMAAGDMVDERGVRVAPESVYDSGLRLYYYRSLDVEPALLSLETVLYQDEHLVVADKPHFMAVAPAGRYLHTTLLVRLKLQLGLPNLAPLHRIDRDTAGLVLLSAQRATRGAYHSLFRDRMLHKTYEAVAPWRADMAFPRVHHSRMEESAQFFRMHEVSGEANSHTEIDVIEHQGAWARYRLAPVTGKRHQLRVHMAALGLPLRNDPLYPEVNGALEGDTSRPLQLLARGLAFTDPLSGQARHFESQRSLQWPVPQGELA